MVGEKDISTVEKPYHLHEGMVEREDGTLEKSKMFEIFAIPLDDYTDIQFSQEEMRRVRMHLMNMKTGIQAMAPLLCGGAKKCPFILRCPIVDRSLLLENGEIDISAQSSKNWPLGRQCPFEREYIDFKRQQYAEEYDINPDSPTEMGMINRLAVLDLWEYRLILVLAHGDDQGEGMDLMKLQPIMPGPGGLVMRTEAHPAWTIREKIHKEREDILKAMVGTRHEKYKQAAATGAHDQGDPSSQMAALRDKLNKLENDRAIDVEYTVVEPEKK